MNKKEALFFSTSRKSWCSAMPKKAVSYHMIRVLEMLKEEFIHMYY